MSWLERDRGSIEKLRKKKPKKEVRIWNKLIPDKIQIFCWQAWQKRIAVKELLVRWNILSEIDLECVFCNNDIETVDHLMVRCIFSWNIWAGIMKWWGQDWVCPGNLHNLFPMQFDSEFKGFNRMIWEPIPFAVCWSIWMARNNPHFQGIQPEWKSVLEIILIRMATWLKAKLRVDLFSIDDFRFNIQGVKTLRIRNKIRKGVGQSRFVYFLS